MNDTKPWYLSVGVWGAVATLVGATLSMLRIEHDERFVADLRDWMLAAATLVGGAMALYGRVRAKRRIGATGDAMGKSSSPLLLTITLCALVLLAGTGCGVVPLDSPSSAYVRADRATHDAVSPEYVRYVNADPALTPEQRERRLRTIESWRARVEAGESATDSD